MLEIGTLQTLQVIKEKEFGVYLAEPDAAGTEQEKGVLLPKKQVPAGTKPGDRLEVFVYRDSEDRLIATTTVPKVTLGNTAVLEVKEVSKIGAFLDMGLERDLLLPFREQTHPVRKGERCLIALYLDKSKRLAATMRVYPYLKNASPYQAGDEVGGFVYEVNEENGAFVAVDERYYGLLPKRERYAGFKVGQEVHVRVEKVREDGKLDLTSRGRAYSEIDSDAAHILQVIGEFDDCLPFNDKASPEVIAREFRLSKNAFKRAVGRLLKEGKIEITDKHIKIK
ncbi:MAG: RNA-binding protein [Lachnospiraceae bacterium]|jgi:predicted RNA-binding protein (virulence factor B family)|nr:RNA-binding protein [Lachnospiraceae bacterium]